MLMQPTYKVIVTTLDTRDGELFEEFLTPNHQHSRTGAAKLAHQTLKEYQPPRNYKLVSVEIVQFTPSSVHTLFPSEETS